MIKEYFSNYFLHMSDVTVDLSENNVVVHRKMAEPWKITLVDTGANTMTGGRLKRVVQHIANEGVFALTYGDGVADINLAAELVFHRAHGRSATVAAVRPAVRFGALELDEDRVVSFQEKPVNEGGWINGGFFLLDPSVLDLLEGDDTIWERTPLETLARTDSLRAFHHAGFWHPMDTLLDKTFLESKWAEGTAPWKVW